MSKRLPKFFSCPSEFTLHVLGGKWKTVILCFIKEGPCRYHEIRRLAPTLSDKMLTERLKDLVNAGLITRCKIKDEGGTTDVYALTERGESLPSNPERFVQMGTRACGRIRGYDRQSASSSGRRPTTKNACEPPA
jgi:DNA-binding HxlR family transcriptional regulator